MIKFANDRSGRKGADPAPIDILIGCPIQKRDWIISEWFWHAVAACKVAGVKPGFLFVMDTSEEPLFTMVKNLSEINGVDLWIVPVEEVQRADKRDWSHIRYERMVVLRNLLLEGVRELGPPLFLSLDSDMLLHEEAIKVLIDTLSEQDAQAVGGKSYLSHTGRAHPTYAMIGYQNSLKRPDSEGTFKVDVLMAIKLMTPPAYNVDYEFHAHGEDIGWSLACKREGLKLWWNGSVCSKHVMRVVDLDKIDARAGF